MPDGTEKRRSPLKMWQRILSILFIVASAVSLLSWEQKECCLCDSFRYHAPCLIDLETGKLVELEMYDPHDTKVAELAESQSRQGLFCLILFEKVQGYVDTGAQWGELTIPIKEKTLAPLLCTACKKQLGSFYFGRYVIADLYDEKEKRIFPITDGMTVEFRCYTLTATKEGKAYKLHIKGDLLQ